ncbi:MAG: SsrA-binding protein SmpB [Sedimentisphaerales bacterium]|nr:SsrA-binding protein SmpB [Sedimentisphaerales bacterium]
MSAKKQPSAPPSASRYTPTIANKKARFHYELLEKLEAGIALAGTEVKSLRDGRANLEDAFCQIREGELYLVGCTIPPYTHGNLANHVPGRPRKLLVHRRELRKLAAKMTQKGLTVVPLRMYFRRGLVKVEIALGRGKSQSDKRESIKEREASREIRQALHRRR